MKRRRLVLLLSIGLALFAAGAHWLLLPHLAPAIDIGPLLKLKGDPEAGAEVAIAAGCFACHSDKAGREPYAGGRAIATPFGKIYAPNITPDRETGIGAWSDKDFYLATLGGIAPDGQHYYPAFPYTSYTRMTPQDAANLKAFLDRLKPIAKQNRAAELSWPYSNRRLVAIWKWLYFHPGRGKPGSEASPRAPERARGRYLVETLGHCGECHTQRNKLGGYSGKPLAGNSNGPDGGRVPSIADLAGKWSKEDILIYLEDGMTPEGDFAGAEMAEVIDRSTSRLPAYDRSAIADYLLSK